MSADPLLTEIEIQLTLAHQALTNVKNFVARLNAASDAGDTTDDTTDSEDTPETYESLEAQDRLTAPPPPTGARNGRKRQHHQ